MNQHAVELRALSDHDLKAQADEAHKELFNLRFRLATRQTPNSSELTRVRRKIARIYTILRERELSENQEEA